MTSSSTNIFCIAGNSDQQHQKKYQLPMSFINPTDTVYGILPKKTAGIWRLIVSKFLLIDCARLLLRRRDGRAVECGGLENR